MSPDFLAVHEHLTVAQAIEQVRKSPAAETASTLYVVDDHDHLVGSLPWRRLVTADPAAPVRFLRQDEPVRVTAEMDQEEVARLVAKYDLVAVPVVSADHRLLGVITVDDVIDVIREEATEDIQRLGGAAGDETVLDPARTVFPKRLVWLLINLATAILAASVIGLFEDSIRELALLAIFMPIVASMGGIGTTQTATVVVRGLALGDMTTAHLWRVVRRRPPALTIGLANGLAGRDPYVWKGGAPGRDHRCGHDAEHGRGSHRRGGHSSPAQGLPGGSGHRLERHHHHLHRRVRLLLFPRARHPADPLPALAGPTGVSFTPRIV
jgi:magnesium transporter